MCIYEDKLDESILEELEDFNFAVSKTNLMSNLDFWLKYLRLVHLFV